MRRTKQWVFILSLLLLCSSGLSQGKDTYSWDLSYAYGNLPLLSSLVTNAGLDLDENERYSDITMNGSISLTEQLHYELSVQATNQPPQLINTKYARADYPISTGRIQKSVVNYNGEAFSIQVGRANMLNPQLRSGFFDYPISADGFSWDYTWEGWSFKHTFQVLPAEKESGQVFRRSVSYHHIAKHFKHFSLCVGEYFILSGNHVPFDLKRFNPFLPFMLNSHDSEADHFNGYSGDTDNSLIKVSFVWNQGSSTYSMRLYIDEFQIDGVDREVNNDALLMSLGGRHNTDAFGSNQEIIWGVSASNPNFGQHPGPFTTTTVGLYPMFEYTPGMKHLVFARAKCELGENLTMDISGYTSDWVEISQLHPSVMNKRAQLDELEIQSDSRLGLGIKYKFASHPILIGMEGWSGENSGYLLTTEIFSSN